MDQQALEPEPRPCKNNQLSSNIKKLSKTKKTVKKLPVGKEHIALPNEEETIDVKEFLEEHTSARLKVTFGLCSNSMGYDSRTSANVLRGQLEDLIAIAIADRRLTLASRNVEIDPKRTVVSVDP